MSRALHAVLNLTLMFLVFSGAAMAAPADTASKPTPQPQPPKENFIQRSGKPGQDSAVAKIPAVPDSVASAQTSSPKPVATSAQSTPSSASADSANTSASQDSLATPVPSDSTLKDAAVKAAAADSAARAESLQRAKEKRKTLLDSLRRQADSTSMAMKAAADSAQKPVPVSRQPVDVRNAALAALGVGGAIQVQAAYHDFMADADADKLLSFALRSLKLEWNGRLDDHFGFDAKLLFAPREAAPSIEDAYIYWQGRGFSRLQAGVQSKTFSRESLLPDEDQPFIGRGRLYQTFLESTTGYTGKDMGLMLQGGFEDDAATLYYQVAAFNGKQSDDPDEGYADAQAVAWDEGFFAKDFTARVVLRYPFGLDLEGALSTKGGEDRQDADNFTYAANTAYQLGAALRVRNLLLEGEVSTGDNHQGRDALIQEGSTQFFAFYAQAGWLEVYPSGRSSGLWLKFEGLDPAMSFKDEGAKNDGKFRYTLGLSYGFSEASSVLANYGFLQPITGVEGEDVLAHDFDLLWRLNF